MAYERIYPTTGYWMFVCNTNHWNADHFLRSGTDHLFYRISKHHRQDFKIGQKGFLRLNRDRRSRQARGSGVRHDAGVYAVFEVVGPPVFAADQDPYYAKSEDGLKANWRVPVRVVANLLHSPVLASDMPDTEDFKHFILPLNTSTIPITSAAYEWIVEKAGLSPTLADSVERDEILSSTVPGIRKLEIEQTKVDPKRKAQISVRIERGKVGQIVKEMNGFRCQVCDRLGVDGVAFIDKRGRPFAEAHHVIPVANMVAGSLHHTNIMVLCPNHHRQAHYGNFEVVESKPTEWIIRVDTTTLTIAKTRVP